MNKMTKHIDDQAEREQALDPRHSYIVQAPAGSGKTELLTQRFLKLLSCVQEPEEILALTFTKKAASEMRSRIWEALKRSQEDQKPNTAHEQTTWMLAKEALIQDQKRAWGLLTNPNRLRIKTIDSFNSLLTRQLPLLSHFGAPLEILDYPRTLYRETVQTVFTQLEDKLDWSQAIARLLLHLDNNFQIAEDLLVGLLSKRDQWLPHMLSYSNSFMSSSKNDKKNSLRDLLEEQLSAVIEESLKNLNSLFPEAQARELMPLIQFACENLKTTKPDSKLMLCAGLTSLPGTEVEDKDAWLGIAELLLTQDKQDEKRTWRKLIDKKLGFPASPQQAKVKTLDYYAQSKQRMKELLEALSAHEQLRHALIELSYLPDAHYSDAQWEILQALHSVLKIVVAQLQLTFKQYGKIDYTENALAALLALGTDEAPTDLALVLDYQINHILVDEFQDTSCNQYELLKKLTQGWQVEEGRSLFLVGDPMQSIYRFREAEVALFLQAKQLGLGSIKLKPLTLSVNFRSRPQLVHWLNSHFNKVLPAFDDLASGAVSYTASKASEKIAESTENPAVQLHAYLGPDQQIQAQGIIHLIQQELNKNPDDKIAILVRSRTHLKALIPALKNAELPYQAVELDPLQTRPYIQDLLALTRALLYPADTIAWLSILRAPWCGLSLNDLLSLAGNRNQELLWQRLIQKELISTLSLDGQKRLHRILPLLSTAIQERRREDLHSWIEQTWLALGGPACLETEADLQDVQTFFGLLKNISLYENGLGLSWTSLEEALKQLYAQTDHQADCRVQIMTIHTAKGLEFDTVILPYLEKGTQKDEKPLLSWLERPLANNNTVLLLAPIHAVGNEEDKIYQHIYKQNKNKTQHEQGRLFYVAATRARKTLHLCMSVEYNDKKELKTPLEGSMLKKIWPLIKNELEPPLSYSTSSDKNQKRGRSIKRLLTSWSNPLADSFIVQKRPNDNKIQGFRLTQAEAQITGTVVHHLLQQLSRFGLSWWNNRTKLEQEQYIKLHLIKNALPSDLVQASIKKVKQAIENTLNDARGIWLLSDQKEAEAELALTALIQGKIEMLVIDRTFIDDKGFRWIIDYKTSVPDKQSLESFFYAEQEKYAKKMQAYRQAISFIDKRPLRLGLYFPLVPAWHEWDND